MRENFISYENYKEHKNKYGHVATWVLWDKDILEVLPSDIDRSYEIRKRIG